VRGLGHARYFDSIFAREDSANLSKVREFSKNYLTDKHDTMLYMFSGPDFLYATSFFPNARTKLTAKSHAMPLSSEEDKFLEVASDALPRIIELIATFPVEHRAGAFEVAERGYMRAARDFGCTEEADRWQL
jgi:hypothetical protein